MFQYLHIVAQVQLVLFSVVLIGLLILQWGALLRHGNRCFQLLVASTICGFGVAVSNGIMVFTIPTKAVLEWGYSSAFLLTLAEGILELIGTTLFIRDYRRLAERVAELTRLSEADKA